MSIYAGPEVTDAGLILDVDAADPNSYSTTVSAPTLTQVDVFLVGGGGGGGGGQIFQGGGGGGGGGGVVYRAGHSIALLSASLPVIVGSGGAGGIGGNTTPVLGTNGGDSSFAGLTALGGGGGGTFLANANNGGSGGGAAGLSSAPVRPPGQATDVTQGKEGGANGTGSPFCGAGGGGAGSAGAAGGVSGNGGAGVFYGDTFGTTVGAAGFFAGGGGGGVYQTPAAGTSGGIGGGGGGTLTAGVNGTANTGGGGGGGGINSNGALTYLAGSGGSGVVIIRYAGDQRAVGGTVTTAGGFTTHVFTSSGTFNRETWQDISGQGNNGTLIGGITYSSSNQGTLVFDGIDSRVQTSYGPQLNDFTVIAWFRSTGGSLNYNRIVDKDYITGMWIGRESNIANRWGGGVLESANPFGRFITLTDDQWHMIVSRRSGTTHTIYGDGITNSVSGTVSSAPLSATTFAFGNYSGSNNVQRLTGNISQVSIYNRALDESEILAIFNAFRSRYGI
jgi:hypothetical protein